MARSRVMSGPSSIATNREDMEGASPPERSVAKTTKLSRKFQAVILNRLEANWRALVRPCLTPFMGPKPQAEGRTRTHGSVESTAALEQQRQMALASGLLTGLH